LPDVPSLVESGLNVRFSQWAALFAPAGLAAPVRAKLAEAAKAAAIDERVTKTIVGAGTPIQYLDGPALARFVQDDARVMAEVVRRIGKQ
jgi:tripartite-type tricarboxylate transporter receptor subunit TctC